MRTYSTTISGLRKHLDVKHDVPSVCAEEETCDKRGQDTVFRRGGAVVSRLDL